MRFFMNSYRTHTCGELRSSDVNKEVKLAGWIHRKRNLGNLCFVDLRDHYGITQCVFDSSSDLFEKIEAIRPESVIGISGKVMMRESINKNIPRLKFCRFRSRWKTMRRKKCALSIGFWICAKTAFTKTFCCARRLFSVPAN